MARKTRESLPSRYVHVTTRGIGRRTIFEDDADRRRFLETLNGKLHGRAPETAVLAWCLMENHAHLLFRAESAELSRLMQRLGTSYAQYFNGRHGHVGRVFQNRFGSQPVQSDSHLRAVIRYIHAKNARDAGVPAPADYVWSSYREIAGIGGVCEGAGIVDVGFARDLFGSVGEFISFHEKANEEDVLVNIDARGRRLGDAEAREVAVRLLGESFVDNVCAMQREERDEALARLKAAGLSIRQIERLTGIGRSVISRASIWPRHGRVNAM